MATKSKILNQLGFIDNEITYNPDVLFSKEMRLSESINAIFYYGKSGQVKTRFYWIVSGNLSEKMLQYFHQYTWNKNSADLLFIENDNTVKIKYINTPPNQDLITYR
jgi:hypothetical protein